MTGINVWIITIATILMGAVSILWISRGMKGITDPLIQKLFKYIMALIVALIAVSLLFITWTYLSPDIQSPDGPTRDPTLYAFLVSISALIIGSSVAVKRIGDEYGFIVKEE